MSAPSPTRGLIEDIIAYENGALSAEETIALFQDLVTSGVIRSLQGSYQRMAQALSDQGLISVT